MTSEGGGKFKQKRSRNSKPYERPKSILNRVGDVVRGVLTPSSWVPSLVSWGRGDVEEVEVEEPTVVDAATAPPSVSNPTQSKVVATSRSSLNSIPGPSGVSSTSTFSVRSNNENCGTVKHRIPLGSSDPIQSSLWNPASFEGGGGGRRTVFTRVDDRSFDRSLDTAAGPSSSTPFVSPNPIPLTRESSESHSRRNVERANGRASLKQQPPTQPTNTYAKLRDIGKLSNDVSSDGRTERHDIENSANLGSDSHSECSEESVSTSGCSSMVPHPDKREYQKDILEIGKPRLQQLASELQMGFNQQNSDSNTWDRSRSIFDRSLETSSSFLWSGSRLSQVSKPQPPPPTNRPQFSTFLFGSPAWSEKSFLRDSENLQSTPYTNKVSYGFGSSHRRARLNATNPYNASASAHRQIKVKIAKNTDLDVMSTTAKRILETLEKMSTPIADAKRIPSLKPDQVQDTPLTFTASAYRRRPNLAVKNTPNISRIESANKPTLVGPPVSRLMSSGSVAVTRTYLRNVELEPAKVVNVAAIGSSKPSESPSRPVQREEVLSKAGGKMKAQHRAGLHYSKLDVNKDVLVGPDLPSIPLPIQNLPKFNFFGNSSTSTPPTTLAVSVESSRAVPSSDTPPKEQNGSNDPSKFTFSSPIVKEAIDSALDTLRKQSVTNFTFSSPITVRDPVSNGEDKPAVSSESVPAVVVTPPPNLTFKSPTSTKALLKMKPILEEWDDNCDENSSKQSAVVSVASELKSGSVMDILGKKSSEYNVWGSKEKNAASKSPSKVTTFSSFGDKFKLAPGSWECPVCMVNNKEDAPKCVACDKNKPAAKRKATVPTTAVSALKPTPAFVGFGDKLHLEAASTWECPTCLLRVNENLPKCVSCETAKPAAVGSSSATGTKPTGMWECDTCMVSNSANVPKCIACESNKPGTAALSAPGTFKFGFTAGASNGGGSNQFKFGIPSATVVATTSSTTSTPTVVSSGAFFTSAVTATTATFKFGLPSVVQTPTKTTSVVTTTTSSTPFSFGLGRSSPELSVASSTVTKPTSSLPLTVGNSAETKVDSPAFNSTVDANVVSKSALSSDVLLQCKKVASDVTATKQDGGWDPTSFTFGSSKPASVTDSSAVSVTSVVTTSLTSTTVSAKQTSLNQTFLFGSAKSSTESGGFSLGSSLGTAPVVGSLSTVNPSTPLPSGGFSFKFGSTNAKSVPPPQHSAVAAQQSIPMFGFGSNLGDSKTNTPSAGLAIPVPATTNTPVSQSSSSSGGFKFQFPSHVSAAPSVPTKRGAPSDVDVLSKKMTTVSGLPSFGVFGAKAASPPTGTFPFGMSASSAAAPTGPIFGALSTVAEKTPSSNTFTFGANAATSDSAAPARTPLFGATAKPAQLQFGASETQATSSISFGATPTTTAAAPVASTSSTSTPSFAPFTFGVQGVSGNNARAAAPLSTFGNVGAAPSTSPAFGTGLQQSTVNLFGSQQPAAPSFGSFGSTTLPAAPVQGFGAAPIAPNGTAFGFSAAPSTFQFGSSAPAPADSGVFTFTANQNADHPQQTSNSGFSFNQQMAAPTAGFNFNPSNQLNFSFGNGGPDQPAAPFNPSQNPFDAHRTGRVIKRAKRRVQK